MATAHRMGLHRSQSGHTTRKAISLLSVLLAGIILTGGKTAKGKPFQIFKIGESDHSYAEFARGQELTHPIIYRVAQSSAAKDWVAYQPGSFDNFSQEPDGVPFQIVFSLPSAPRGKFVLHLDAIIRQPRPAAPRYTLEINGHSGSYQLRPGPAPELWWPTGAGGPQFIGYESLDMPLPASYFRRGENTLTVRCIDGYGIYYDAFSLANEPEGRVPLVTAAWVQPTIFYKTRDARLVELAEVNLWTTRPIPRRIFLFVLGGIVR